ncbi:MAG TPA: PVC-type heme-binding CxxCH protein [Planctomycetota bacterium]|nr:PVC-type heme-binding CxxCH protein [Planctomycetota bacterium]
MKRLLPLLLLLGLPGSAPVDPPPFEVPEGFTIELVAGPPLVERPIMASFDDHGRLYVTDSAGVNLRGSELLKDPPHKIRLLEDTDGDGKFDTSRVWADKLVFPQGLLWHQGAIYCTSPPSFWKLEDSAGTGVCDKRTELVTGLANTGVADDAHGACLGPDGRIYFLPGRMAHNLHTPDGKFAKKAVGPWLMRCRTDGSEVEIVSGCQGNPVEVDWTPEGDFFISGTFWAPDSFGGGLRDALIHGVEGGEYSVRDRVYTDRKRTGDFLPVMVPMIATAPAGMVIAKSDALGFKGNLLCTYFNPHKVQRHILERDGATWKSKNEEFITSKSPDFHPTDVLEDADGSLLVVDTGGWFRIGCPTSQIAKPQVLGGIYRIRKKGAPAVEDPRGLKADWTDLGKRLGDPRWMVRQRAIELAAARKPAEIARLIEDCTGEAKLGALWAMTRNDDPQARAVLAARVGDANDAVRQVACISAGLHRDPKAVPGLIQALSAPAQQVRREAACALGRIGDPAAVRPLLEAVRAGGDRFLEHALIYALLRIGDRDGLLGALQDPSPQVRRAALIALDQMENGNLKPEMVTPLLDPIDLALQQAALKVITSHSGWSNEIFGLVREWLSAASLDPERAELLKGVLVSFSGDPAMQDLMATSLREDKTSPALRLLVLESMARALPERYPATWLAEARWSLDSGDERVVRQAVALLRASGVGDFDDVLLRLGRDEAKSAELRVEALQAAAPRLAKLDGALFRFLLSCMDKERAPLLRLSAAEAVGKSPLDDAQLGQLTQVVAGAGPLEMPRLIACYERSKSASVAKKLFAVLEAAPGFQSMTAENLRKVLKGYPDEIRQQAEPIAKKLEVDTAQMKAKLDSMASLLEKGDSRAGREVFLGKKAGCTACHTVAGQGGKVGPDLSKIGSIRASRDLLEAIVFPSATFARGYEPFLIRTKGGGIYDGLITRETPEAIYLFTSERLEKRIPRASVEVLQQSKVSIMPQGLDNQISPDELRDLLAFLTSLR